MSWLTRKFSESFRLKKSEKCTTELSRFSKKKQNGLKNLSNDLGLNTIFAITETWLTERDEFKDWDISPKTHKCFRYDRKCVDKTKDGGILLFIPCRLESNELPGFNLCNAELFESIWVEQPQLASHVNKV